MAHFQIRKPTWAEAVFGICMGSTVTLMPVGYDYLLHGAVDPEIRWGRLAIVWLTACMAFAIAAPFCGPGSRR